MQNKEKFIREDAKILGRKYTRLTDRETGVHYIGETGGITELFVELHSCTDIPDKLEPFIHLAEHLFFSVFKEVNKDNEYTLVGKFMKNTLISYDGSCYGKRCKLAFNNLFQDSERQSMKDAGMDWCAEIENDDPGISTYLNLCETLIRNDFISDLFAWTPYDTDSQVLSAVTREANIISAEMSYRFTECGLGKYTQALFHLGYKDFEMQEDSYFQYFTPQQLVSLTRVALMKILDIKYVYCNGVDASNIYGVANRIRDMLTYVNEFTLPEKDIELYNTLCELPSVAKCIDLNKKKRLSDELLISVEYPISEKNFIKDLAKRDLLSDYLFEMRYPNSFYGELHDVGLTYTYDAYSLEATACKIMNQKYNKNKGIVLTPTIYHYYIADLYQASVDKVSPKEICKSIQETFEMMLHRNLDMKTIHIVGREAGIQAMNDSRIVFENVRYFGELFNCHTLAQVKKYLEYDIRKISAKELEEYLSKLKFDFHYIFKDITSKLKTNTIGKKKIDVKCK